MMSDETSAGSGNSDLAMDGKDNFGHSNLLEAESRSQYLADMGYYERGFRDPAEQQSPTMEILLSGDENSIKAEYARRRLDQQSRHPDGTKLYDNKEVLLMGQVLHGQERLAEARRQIVFFEDLLVEGAAKTAPKVQVWAEEFFKGTDEMLKKASDWKIKSTYKPRFDTLVQHIVTSKIKVESLLEDIRVSKKRPRNAADDVQMSDVPEIESIKKARR